MEQSKLGLVVCLGLAQATMGCGDDGGGAGADAGSDPIDGGNRGDCASIVATNQTFSSPQGEGARSFQSHAYFDGVGIWVVHAIVPAGAQSIQIEALRVACDGSVLNPPRIISPEDSFTHTEPRIAGYGEKVMIAWSTDNGSAPTNLSTHYRVFDKVEGPGSVETMLLDTQYKGASAGNTWMPELAASASGFALAGLRGVSDFNSFQSFVQRVSADGAMSGTAIDGELQDGLWQGQADLIIDDAGNVILGWERTEEDDSKHVVQVRIPAGQSAPESAPVRMSNEKGSQVSLGGTDDRGFYVASSREAGGLLVKPATALDPSAPELNLGGGTVALYPHVAAGESGGLVAWLEGTSGVEANLHLQAFTSQDGQLSADGEERIVVTKNASIGAYRVSLVNLYDEVYLVTWTEGPVTELQVKWRFVDMSVAPRN